MDSLKHIAVRDITNTMSPTTINLMIVLLVLVLFALICIGALYAIRSYRKSRTTDCGLPMYNDSMSGGRSNAHRLTINASRNSNIYVYNEKANLIENSCTPPQSPNAIPEIRITFPDEQDDAGRRKSGRVVVVRVGDNGGVGLEPVNDDGLPPYERTGGQRFDSVDLDRVGGLKEKPIERRWS
jgi:hypothetical protein